MPRILSRTLALIAASAVLLVSCRKEVPAPVATDASATLKVPEMHCASCVGTIRAALRGVPGVDATPVFDLEKREVSVKWASAQVDRAAIESAIVKSGFKVESGDPEDPAPVP
ncbi:MAG: heavy-metal-associated domain-containing protein [Verrucomicrobiales bacterium]